MKLKTNIVAVILSAAFIIPNILTAEIIPGKASIQAPTVAKRQAAVSAATANSDESDIYNVVMLLKEDFSKFTNGTPDQPSSTALDGYIPDEKTETPGWSAYYAYEAGGCVAVDRHANNNANISTPILEIPNNGMPVIVTFSGCLLDPSYDREWVEVYMAEVVKGADGTDEVYTHANDYAYAYNDEWKEYSFEFAKARKGTRFFFSFHGYDSKVLFDNIEIKFLEPKVAAPTVKSYTNFKTDGFTANWEAVEGADHYLVNLYTINNDRDKTRNYIVENRVVNGLSTDFTGLDTPTTVYYYTVRAVKGSDKSPESNAMRIHSLVLPTALTATESTEGVKLTWDMVPGAQYYEIEAFRSHTATTDETVILARENFDGLKSEGTLEHPYEDLPAQELLDEYTEQPGWGATYPAHIDGAYCIIGYFYQQNGRQVYLESPYLDMSAAGGKINVSVDFYARGVYKNDKCTAIMRTLKLVDDELITTDRFESESIPEEWTTVTTTLSGGTENSVFDICSQDGWLFIDNIVLSQDIKAGETVKAPYASTKAETNEIMLPVNDLLQGHELIYRIRAVKEVWDDYGFSCDEYVYSPYTSYNIFSVKTAGIEDIKVDTTSINDVYNLQGIRVLRNADPAAVSNLPAGIYIINGKKTAVK